MTVSLQPDWKRSLRKRRGPRLEEPVATNVEIVGHSRVEGRVDGLQLQYQERGGRSYLYVGHLWSGGVSVLDVTSPASPEVVAFIPVPNDDTWHVKVQVADDVLMVPAEPALFRPGVDAHNAAKGVRFFDVSDPTAPRELGFWESGPVGVHRSWWNGGRYAYLSAGVAAPGLWAIGAPDATRVLTTLDVSDPENPRHVSDFWLPTQLGEGPQPLPGESVFVHEPVVEGDRAYVAYWDGGFAIVDVSEPAEPRLVSHVPTYPELSDGNTHTCVPLPERNLLVVADESLAPWGLEGPKEISLWDIADETAPRLVSMMPVPEPSEREPYATYYQRGERFGPHCLHDNHAGTLRVSDRVYNAYTNAGLRVFDISDPTRPRESASFVPPDPAEIADPRPVVRTADGGRGGTRGACSQDVLVDPRGYVYLSGYNDGIWVLRETNPPAEVA